MRDPDAIIHRRALCLEILTLEILKVTAFTLGYNHVWVWSKLFSVTRRAAGQNQISNELMKRGGEKLMEKSFRLS